MNSLLLFMNLRFAAVDVKREEQTEPFEPGSRADQEG